MQNNTSHIIQCAGVTFLKYAINYVLLSWNENRSLFIIMTMTKKRTIVKQYLRSVNMNSFAPFQLVGESATLLEYKGNRLLMHGAQAVTDFGSNLPTSSASRPRATKHTYCENDHFHEPTGTWYAHQIISLISLS